MAANSRALFGFGSLASFWLVSLNVGLSPDSGGIADIRTVSLIIRSRILDAGLMTKLELDEAIVECEKVAGDPQTTGVTFVVTQLWGRKPL